MSKDNLKRLNTLVNPLDGSVQCLWVKKMEITLESLMNKNDSRED